MNISVHTDWATDGFSLTPMAPRVGPFPLRPYLSVWWSQRASDDSELTIVEGSDGLATLVRTSEHVEFAGEADLTDYHSPLGANGAAVVASYVESLDAGTTFRFDSLPIEAAGPLSELLDACGISHLSKEHTVAAVLPLPATFDDYLMAVGKKERHETRRKRRRFAAALGEPQLRDVPDGLDEFVAMHRTAAGDKGGFMDDAMVRYFTALLEEGNAELHLLYGSGDHPVAGAFGWDGPGGYYLYNSAYHPDYRDVSPGVVMLAGLIERAIDLGHGTFDFLKGDETYKFRLGAEPRPLYEITGIR